MLFYWVFCVTLAPLRVSGGRGVLFAPPRRTPSSETGLQLGATLAGEVGGVNPSTGSGTVSMRLCNFESRTQHAVSLRYSAVSINRPLKWNNFCDIRVYCFDKLNNVKYYINTLFAYKNKVQIREMHNIPQY